MPPTTRSSATALRRPAAAAAAGVQARLLGAGALIVFGSFLPWAMTPLGNLSGIRGAGLWTLYLGLLALPGAVVRSSRVAFWHAVLAAVPAVALPSWQLARLAQLNLLAGSWGVALPGLGLVLVLAGGVLAAGAAFALRD